MRLIRNRILAWIVLVVCVIGSIVGFGGGSLARERRDIMDVFYDGAEDRDSTHSMSAYLSRAYENARIMALEVHRIHGDDGWLNDIAHAFDAGVEPGAYKYISKLNFLRQLADEMYNEIYAADLTDAQRRDFKLAYDDFQGAIRQMEKDPYFELAAGFNDLRRDSFISEGVCSLWGIEPLAEPL